MAFSKQPVNSTYQTKAVGLVKELNSRGATTAKDSYYLNAYAEINKNKDTQENEIMVQARAGSWTPVASTDSGGIRGAYLWKDQNKIFLAILSKIYVYNSTNLTLITTLNAVFGTTTGYVGFEEFLFDDTSVKMVATDGTTLVTIDTANTVVPCADADMPVHLPYPVFLDGYIFVVKTNSSSIYNSDINNPLSWTAAEFIDAEMRPDQVARIALLNNYLVALGTKTIEYFYDAANATGSPLSRNDSPTKGVGYVGGFAHIANKIYFVGEESESTPDVFVLEDFKITNLGTEAIRRFLEPATYANIQGAIVSFNGHDFYVMSTDTATYAFDLDTKLWGKWSYKSGATFPINFTLTQQAVASTPRCYFTTTLDQSLNLFQPLFFTDAGLAMFPIEVVTDNEYFDSYNRKTCNRLTIYADKPTSTMPISVQYSDDDYQTWSTARTIDLFQELPCQYRWGQFRRRAHKLSYTGNNPFRLFKLELDLNLGNT